MLICRKKFAINFVNCKNFNFNLIAKTLTKNFSFYTKMLSQMIYKISRFAVKATHKETDKDVNVIFSFCQIY